jgi:transposase
LKLIGLNENALQVDEEILMFDEDLQAGSITTALALDELPQQEKLDLQKKFLEYVRPKPKPKKEDKLETHIQTKVFILQRLSLKEIAKKRDLKVDTIVSHIEKLVEEGHEMDISHLRSSAPKEAKMKKIHDAFKASFEKNGDYRFGPVKAMLGPAVSYDEIRMAKLFFKSEE